MIFTILGKPVPKQRPYFGKGHAFTPKRTHDFEKYVRECYQSNGSIYFESAIKCTIEVYYELPKKFKKVEKEVYATKRPDLDNIAKSILDSLNGIAYKDDSQIVELNIFKKYGKETQTIVKLQQAEN